VEPEVNQIARQGNRTALKLVWLAVAMFGFGFALVPLYNVFCDITGLNGKTANEAAQQNKDGIDRSREIRVQFVGRPAKSIPWQFRPEINEIVVHPGEVKLIKFYAENESARDMVAQAIPSISPGLAASHFKKIECFCFNQQPLKSKQNAWMPLRFYVDLDVPEEIHTLTLSYTLFDVTQKADT